MISTHEINEIMLLADNYADNAAKLERNLGNASEAHFRSEMHAARLELLYKLKRLP